MEFPYLTIENLLIDVETFTIDKKNSYHQSYPEFIRYFKELDRIEKHHLIICTHFTYGWMPTVLKLDLTHFSEILEILNDARRGRELTANELDSLSKLINNSMVGVSKLLHFIQPNKYAIWDSRTFRYATGMEPHHYRLNKADNYLAYLEAIGNVGQDVRIQSLHAKIASFFGYQISKFRAIELLMFVTDIKRNTKIPFSTKVNQ
ncbi:MAG: hypothetical protein KDD15_11825 [Lewinella sp.]|nr:hypothetical protein [Lewinella sp.]